MNRIFVALLIALLGACSTSQRQTRANDALPLSSAIYPSPDGHLYATIRRAKEPYTVAIIERESGKVLGVAKSSVRLSEKGDRMHGEVRVTYAADLSTIVVHEEFSDASPNPRYILFQRQPGSAAYQTSYFAPPTAHTDAPGEFDFICPSIEHVTRDTMTLGYFGSNQKRIVRIAELLQTRTARSSGEWPSEAYKRYE